MGLNVDLHSHSTQSDGVLAPAEVARRAHEQGVDCWALTDHDSLRGLDEAADAARALGMIFVPGVEISASFCGQTVHVVGLNIDPNHEGLRSGLARIRNSRFERAREMGVRLAQCGVEGAFEGALRQVGNPDLIGRLHFARHLVAHGHCKTLQQAFDRYLADGKRAFVPIDWAALDEAVGWILAAGGKAVVAHPGRYRYTPLQQRALFDRFRELGGQAIEVMTGSHTAPQCSHFAQVALEYGFQASRGSDFHAPGAGRVDLGELPSLPESLVPVWRDWLEDV